MWIEFSQMVRSLSRLCNYTDLFHIDKSILDWSMTTTATAADILAVLGCEWAMSRLRKIQRIGGTSLALRLATATA